MNIYVTLCTTMFGDSSVQYAGEDHAVAWKRGEEFLIKHPHGSFMVERWNNGGLAGGYGRDGKVKYDV